MGKKRKNKIVVKVGSLKVFIDRSKERDDTKRYQCIPKHLLCKQFLLVITDKKYTKLSNSM